MISKCAICGKKFTFWNPSSEYNRYMNKPVHDDCYYEEMGEEMEKHPICNPETVMRMRKRKGK